MHALNDEKESSKAKLSALAKLAECARTDPDAVLSCFSGVDEAFERLLLDKHQAHLNFGTALGRMHETVLLVLIRATRYTLTTAQLLDFLRGVLALAMTVMQQLIICKSYEDEVIACALGLLCGTQDDGSVEVKVVHDGFRVLGSPRAPFPSSKTSLMRG